MDAFAPQRSVVVASADHAAGQAIAAGLQRRGLAARAVRLRDALGQEDEILVLDSSDGRAVTGEDVEELRGDGAARVVLLSAERGEWLGHAAVDAVVDPAATFRELLAAIRGDEDSNSQSRPRVSADLGDQRLTQRERLLLQHLLAGSGIPQIAERWGVSEDSVRTHELNAMSKVGVSRRPDLMAWALQVGLQPRDAAAGASS